MTDAADLDALLAALAQLRGRPRPPFGPGAERGGPGGFGRGGPHHRGHHDHEHIHDHRTPGPHGRFGGGPARLRLLEALVAASRPLTVGEVADAIGVDQPRASRLVQQAVGLGLVRREADPDDARRTRIALTDEGARIARGFRGERRERLQSALAGFSADERTELVRLLTKLAVAWPQA